MFLMDNTMTDKEVEELVKEEKREYARQWRKNNKDKVRETNKRYWEKRTLKKLKEQEEETGK